MESYSLFLFDVCDIEALRLRQTINVRSFSTFDEMEQALREDSPDVVAVGAGERTMEVLTAIAAEYPQTPVLVVAQKTTSEQALAFLEAGAADVVTADDPRGVQGALLAIRRRESAAKRVFEALPVGVWLVTASRHPVPLNHAAREMADAAIVALGPHGEDRLRGARLPDRGCSGEAGETVEISHADGRKRTLVTSLVPLQGPEGSLPGAILIAEDVTERRQFENRVLQAQKMESVGLLAGGIAHDFNNLLTAINGYGQILQENLPSGDELLTVSVEQIVAAGKRASELTQKLLAFSRKQPLNPVPLKVDDMVSNAACLLDRVAGTGVTVATSLSAHDAKVMVDPAQIDQVLLNLVINARDALDQPGGRVTISTRDVFLQDAEARWLGLEKGGEYAVISVSDDGPGMDDATREKIFEPFFTTKATGKGPGLGLAIIYGIIRQHGGAIEVESRPGTGTTFKIYLATVRSRPRRGTGLQRVIPFGGAEKILLAEDDDIVRDYLSTVLAQSGYVVVTACDGLDAGAKFREHANEVALVITDVVMPRKNGREIHEEIKKIKPEMKIIYISGYTADIINKKGIVDRNIDFLMKPVSRGDLLQKVREVLDRQ